MIEISTDKSCIIEAPDEEKSMKEIKTETEQLCNCVERSSRSRALLQRALAICQIQMIELKSQRDEFERMLLRTQASHDASCKQQALVEANLKSAHVECEEALRLVKEIETSSENLRSRARAAIIFLLEQPLISRVLPMHRRQQQMLDWSKDHQVDVTYSDDRVIRLLDKILEEKN